MICNLQRYATHDGPGIRTVVFLKGCSLSCRWCQNPESRLRKADLLYDERLCLTGCQRCSAKSVGFHRNDTTGAVQIMRAELTETMMRQAADICPSGALSLCGEVISAEQIMKQVLRDNTFYQRSGGGVTLSGGEPFMQPEMTQQLLHLARTEGIHTAVESCLHVPWHHIEPAISLVDLWLIDIKHVDADKFLRWTNGRLALIQRNIQQLGEHAANVQFRVPIIPEFNDDEPTLTAIIQQASAHYDQYGGNREIHFLPYHTYGMHKYHLLGLDYQCARQPLERPELLAFAEQKAKDFGLTAILRG
ncbi:glycyl-radical enzyme activating protein [Tolumonas lignilytica]|uniref:glycyl-radical enzyme activating protein n=1 Tax=Tolumonas lignilytica TaxID=1283284 RepID=UPI000463C701|nr:glycyl-radical enzyme activating protein [Tolumonas lignilytica]